jgi:exodeoxyribonuclease-5
MKVNGELTFVLRDGIDANIIIIDESSMVGSDQYEDLASFGVPIVAIGDPGQLPPVNDSDVNLMARPDYTLETIHRQAEGSGIISIANEIRTNPQYEYRETWSKDVEVVHKSAARHLDADVYICGFNKTRASLNKAVRKRRKLEGLLTEGEKIIVLGNDKHLGVYNGLMGTVQEILLTEQTKVYPKGKEPQDIQVFVAKVLWDGYEQPSTIRLSSFVLTNSESPVMHDFMAHKGKAAVIDYGYAITCHKAQGSEFDHVVVIYEEFPKFWDQSRWMYTAVTRASKKLTIGVPGI